VRVPFVTSGGLLSGVVPGGAVTKSASGPLDLLSPGIESALRAPTALTPPLDKTLVTSFLRALARLVDPEKNPIAEVRGEPRSAAWELRLFPHPQRPYHVPLRGDVALLAARTPDLTKEFVIGVKRFCRDQDITRLYLYDTRLSDRVVALCKVLEPHLKTLVIRDHHGVGEGEQAGVAELREKFGSRADIRVVSKKDSPTCFDLLSENEGELIRGEGKALVITAPLDLDSLNCIARGFGLSYQGQNNDVLAIEAKDRVAQRAGVSPLGDLILDALRVGPMVLKGRSSETFASLFQIAALQAIHHASSSHGAEKCSDTPAGETLSMLATLAKSAKELTLVSLLKRSVVRDQVVSTGAALNVCVVDLGDEGLVESAAHENMIPQRFERIGVRLNLAAAEVRRELRREPERLRMSTLEDVCSHLIRQKELPRNIFVFVRYPGEEGRQSALVRFAAFGEYRHAPFAQQLPWEMSRVGLGVIEDESKFFEWLKAPAVL
jgi:hypothetical protein